MRFVFLLLLLCGNPLLADSFGPPNVQGYPSANRNFVFVVTPAGFQEPKYPHPTTDPAIQKFLSENKVCVGALLEYSPTWNAYFAIWMRPIINSVSPVFALVSDDGAYVVTSGDAYGSNEQSIAVAIYNSEGYLIKSFTPVDLLGDRSLDEIPQTSSSILWGKLNSINSKEQYLVVDMWKSGDPFSEDCKYHPLKINLKDGSFIHAE